jgi:hypothetical protein
VTGVAHSGSPDAGRGHALSTFLDASDFVRRCQRTEPSLAARLNFLERPPKTQILCSTPMKARSG